MSAEPEPSWEKELAVLLDEMPAVLTRPLRRAYGLRAGAGEPAKASPGEILHAWHRGFEALAALTYNVALAVIVASQPEGRRSGVVEKLLEQLTTKPRARKPKSRIPPWPGQPRKTLYTWLYLIQRTLKRQIEEFCPLQDRPQVLQHMLGIPTSEEIKTRDQRNTEAHTRGTSVISPLSFKGDETLLREETRKLFGFWRQCALGYAGKSEFVFENKRFGDLPQREAPGVARNVTDTLPPTRTAVLVERSVGSDPVLWSLAPFVVYERFDESILRKYGVPEDDSRDGAYRHLDWCHGEVRPLLWHGLDSIKNYEKIDPAGADQKPPAPIDLRELIERASRRQNRFSLSSKAVARLVDPIEDEASDFAFELNEEAAPLIDKIARESGVAGAGAETRQLWTDRSADIDTEVPRAVVDDVGSCVVLRTRLADSRLRFAAKVLRKDEDDRSVEAYHRELAFLKGRRGKSAALGCFPTLAGWGAIHSNSRSWHGQPFFVQEFVQGTIRSTIRSKKKEQERIAGLRAASEKVGRTWTPSEEEILRVVKVIAHALYLTERVAHTLKKVYESVKDTVRDRAGEERKVHFLHRDITPENLLDRGSGRIVLCDFNSAYLCGPDQVIYFPGERMKSSGEFVYNTHLSRTYCAPEVWSMPPLFSETADVFSVGLVLDELLFGEPHQTQQRAEALGYGGCTTPGDVSAREKELGRRLGFYTPPEEDSIEARALEQLRAFAKRPPEGAEMGPEGDFDLGAIVDAATAPAATRSLMPKLLDRVSAAGRTVRLFLAHRARAAVATALGAEGGARSASLGRALRVLAAALGWYDFEQHRGGPLQMVLCEECYAKQPEWNDTFPKHRPCVRERFPDLVRKLEGLSSRLRLSTSGDGSHEIDEHDLQAVLELTDQALKVCPGLIELEPEQTAARSPNSGGHETFARCIGEEFMNRAVANLTIVSVPVRPTPLPPVAPAHRPKSLAEAIIHFIVTLGDDAAYRVDPSSKSRNTR